MTKILTCECGYIVRGETDDELVGNCEEHIRENHPDMIGKVSREDVLEMAEEE